DHADDAADAKNAMGGVLGLESEKRECEEQQGQRGVAGGQQIEREERQKNGDDAYHSRHDRAGMIELRKNRQRAKGEQQESDVGVHQLREQPLLERHVIGSKGLSNEMQRGPGAVVSTQCFPLEGPEERWQ